MTEKFLGHAIKKDRLEQGVTQAELQRKVRALSILEDDSLNEKEKEVLLAINENYTEHNGKTLWVNVAGKLISNIERGLARTISEYELSLIARALGLEAERYFGLEINPMKYINKTKGDVNNSDNTWFDRSIEFTPEFRQAGVTILSFFSEVVQSEYSDIDVKVGILQEGNTVTLRVETPEGEVLKEIEKTLETYGMVVMGNLPIETISDNRELIRDLKTKLEVTNLELRLRNENSIEQGKQYESRILGLEEQVKSLHNMIGSNLANHTQLTEIIKSLVKDEGTTKNLKKALKTIDQLATAEFTKDSADKMKASLNQIEQESPGIVGRLITTLESIPASILSNLASPWVQSLLTSLPK